jgi:uncharacterized membrane protein YfcA
MVKEGRMDWNRGILIIAETVAVAVLGACVALGHDSSVTDGLLAVVSLLTGQGVYVAVKKKPTE